MEATPLFVYFDAPLTLLPPLHPPTQVVFELVCQTVWQRFFKDPLGARFVTEVRLKPGLDAGGWTGEAMGKLAGRKRTRKITKCQAVVRSFLTRLRLDRARERAIIQRDNIMSIIIRARALHAAWYVLDVVLAQVPVLVQSREEAARSAGTMLARTTVNDAVRRIAARGVPLQELGRRAVTKTVLRSVMAIGRWRAYYLRRRAQREAASAIKHGFKRALMFHINRGLMDNEYTFATMHLPPAATYDRLRDDDSVITVESDPEGLRYSTLPERRFWTYHKRLMWATRLVQRSWRGHLGREAIRNLIKSVFVKKWDRAKRRFAATTTSDNNSGGRTHTLLYDPVLPISTHAPGQFYFLNTRTGEITWLQPHGAGKEGVDLKVTCVECHLNVATKMCVECEDAYW